MNGNEADEPTPELVFEHELDASPETVWRAISVPAFREKWLPGEDLATADPVSAVPGEHIRYRMREDEPPFLESIVTFQVRRDPDGGTILRIVHGPVDARLNTQGPSAANGNEPVLMRAA